MKDHNPTYIAFIDGEPREYRPDDTLLRFVDRHLGLRIDRLGDAVVTRPDAHDDRREEEMGCEARMHHGEVYPHNWRRAGPPPILLPPLNHMP